MNSKVSSCGYSRQEISGLHWAEGLSPGSGQPQRQAARQSQHHSGVALSFEMCGLKPSCPSRSPHETAEERAKHIDNRATSYRGLPPG